MLNPNANRKLEKYDKIGFYINWKVCKLHVILDCKKWYKRKPKTITEAKGTTILWDFAIQTDKKKRRAINQAWTLKEKHAILLIWHNQSIISVIEYNKVISTKTSKKIQKLWHLKITTVPVILRFGAWSRKGQINTLTK